MENSPTLSPVQPTRCTRRGLWIAVGLFLATLVLFSRAWPNDFVNYDDQDYVTANPHVRAGLIGDGVRWAFLSGDVSYWHPLTWLSHMADWSLYGANAHGHHATSIVLHALNAALAFLVLRRLTGAFWLSALAAALFAWHPLRVESVAWVSERKDVLSGLFTLATVGVYAGFAVRRRDGAPGAWRWYAGALVLFAAGLMSKPMVVTVPVLLLILDFWPLGRMSRGRLVTLGLEKVPFLALSGIVSWVTYVAQVNVGTLTNVLSLNERLANAVVAVARYLGKMFLPRDLAVLYPHPGQWPTVAVALSLLLFVVITGVASWQWRRRPWLLAGWLWFLVALLPASGIVQVGIQSMADRYTYLPSLGITVAVLWTLHEFARHASARAVWGVPACAVLAGLVVATWNQLSVWSNSLTLFHHTIAVAGKGNYLAYNNRGVALFHEGRLDDAIADYQRSLEIFSNYPEANNNLGDALAKKGRREEAIAYYRRAISVSPKLAQAHNNLANALSDAGASAEAFEHYETALRLKPNDPMMLNNYGAALGMAGRLDESLARLLEADRINPREPGLQSNLGNALAIMGRVDEAAARFRNAIELDPKDAPRARFNLGVLYFQHGQFDKAVPELRAAVELTGPTPPGFALLGQSLVQVGRTEEGIRYLRESLRLRPDNPQAASWLEEATRTNAARGPAK